MSLWASLGLAPSEEDKRIKRLVDSSRDHVTVLGKCTVVRNYDHLKGSEELEEDRERAKRLVQAQSA